MKKARYVVFCLTLVLAIILSACAAPLPQAGTLSETVSVAGDKGLFRHFDDP